MLLWPGKSQPAKPRVEVRGIETYGHGEETGTLFHADSLAMLTWLLENGWREGVDLIAIDPPFGGGGLYTRRVHLRGEDASVSLKAPAYKDDWSPTGYLQFMYERLTLMHALLKQTGSLYLHVDTSQAHYLKILCDEVFGRENFQREIVWRIGWVSGYKTQARNWIRNHDTILFYSRDPERFHFEKQYAPYLPGYMRRGSGRPKGKGHPLEDTWNSSPQDSLDSIQIKSFSGEKTGYPTQKNEALLERILGASCPPGGVVLDCFVGSGTTAAVADRMSRRWLAGDCSPAAIHTVRNRILQHRRGQLGGSFRTLEIAADGQAPPHSAKGNAQVRFSRSGSSVRIEVGGYESPVLEDLVQRGKAKPVRDWRSVIDAAYLDYDYSGGSFRIDTADVPLTPEAPVRGVYQVESKGRVALRLADVFGSEALVTEREAR